MNTYRRQIHKDITPSSLLLALSQEIILPSPPHPQQGPGLSITRLFKALQWKVQQQNHVQLFSIASSAQVIHSGS